MQALVKDKADAIEDTFPAIVQDLQFANGLIAQAMTKSSWSRNKSWVLKFQAYVRERCPGLIRSRGIIAAILSDRIVLAFLASVVREDPKAKTRVGAAKRAVNFLRALADARPSDDDPNVRLMARGARDAVARTVRQSPAFHAAFVSAIISEWGSSPIWWKRQTALMIVLSVCTLARGDESVSCRQDGIAWIRHDGTQVRHRLFGYPEHLELSALNHLRGFLVLFPSRKNKLATPTWLPVVNAAVMLMLAKHLHWLAGHRPGTGGCLFPARKLTRKGYASTFAASAYPNRAMSAHSFRLLIRLALVECCGLSEGQAKEFGTHSLRTGAIEILRQKGVPAEIRQQLGGWMSASSALGYLQLPVGAQFNLLKRIFE
jgi:hypothetical protein